MYYYQINETGMSEIYKWISESIEKNKNIKNLKASGIAEEIQQDIHLENDLDNNSEFNWETGYKEGRGCMMFISFGIDCFDKIGVSYERL